ncbi:hypothetical protein A1Q2_01049 [Trichosporon asahii var. asahii CBS 8904]|uniref:Uncharacterized protein n=1 Tax=Trichosporon asahii var. asahii (strain CBS 8904) TaxID=1220162 RepID=K1VKG7_TRIAC|nr:hypothetical protein A1Q2_01049 [Trichosporon asahii var. asahii CBS 8904]
MIVWTAKMLSERVQPVAAFPAPPAPQVYESGQESRHEPGQDQTTPDDEIWDSASAQSAPAAFRSPLASERRSRSPTLRRRGLGTPSMRDDELPLHRGERPRSQF